MALLPGGLRLTQLRSLEDLRSFARCSAALWEAAAHELACPADSVEALSSKSAEDIRGAAKAAVVNESEGCASGRHPSPLEAAQIALVWRLACAITRRTDEAKDELESAEWFEVTFDKVFVKKAPQGTAKTWGFVHLGDKLQIMPQRAKDPEGRVWAELSFFQLAASCPDRLFSDDPLGRGWALMDGGHLGLGRLLSGPLPPEAWPTASEQPGIGSVTMYRMNGEKLTLKVKSGELVQSLVQRTAGLMSTPPSRLRLVDSTGSVLPPESSAAFLIGQQLNVVVVAAPPRGITGSEDGNLRLWDLSDLPESIGTLSGHRGAVWCAAVDFERQLLLSGSADTSLRLWDLATMKCTRILEGHTGAVCCISADFARRSAVSGSDDGTLRIWNFDSRSSQVLRGSFGAFWALVANFGRNVAISGSSEGCVQVWCLSPAKATPIRSFSGQHHSLVQVVEAYWSDEVQLAVSGSDDGTACVWDLQALCLLRRLDRTREQLANVVWSVSACNEIAVSSSWEKGLEVWDLSSSSTASVKKCLAGGRSSALAADYRAERLVAASYNGGLTVFDLQDLSVIGSVAGEGAAVRTLCVSFT